LELYITSDNDTSNAFATRFSWSSSVPFLTRVLPKGRTNNPLKEGSLLNIYAQNILLVSSKPTKDGKGIILHLRETDGKPASLDLTNLFNIEKNKKFTQVNVLEEKIKQLSEKIDLLPYETKIYQNRNH